MLSNLKGLALLLLMLPSGVAAQDSREIDPVTVSPEAFTVLLENEHVRVVSYTLEPGQRDEWHTHPPKISVVVSGGELRITPEGEETFISVEELGSAAWMDSLGRHFAENVGSTPVQIVLVEVKAARRDPGDAS